MNDTLQSGSTRWSTYQIAYHFVWIPKYRRRILTGTVALAVKEALARCCEIHGFTLLAVETDKDHVHAFISAAPQHSPSKIVGLLKGHSSRTVRRQFPDLAKRTGRDQLWTQAYYVGTAGQVSAQIIQRYITHCQNR